MNKLRPRSPDRIFVSSPSRVSVGNSQRRSNNNGEGSIIVRRGGKFSLGDNVVPNVSPQQPQNESTERKTKSCLKRILSFFKEHGESRPPECMSPTELDQMFAFFFKETKRLDGEEFQPISLKSFQNSLDRYLKTKNYPYSVLNDKVFMLSRNVLWSRKKELKKQGKVVKPITAETLARGEEEQLWKKGYLGNMNDPHSLQRTVWFFNQKAMRFKGSCDAYQLKWGDVQLRSVDQKTEYLQINKGFFKRKSSSSGVNRLPQTRILPNIDDPLRCPIRFFKAFVKKRPSTMLQPDSPFYLAMPNKIHNNPTWLYKSCKLGIHALERILRVPIKSIRKLGEVHTNQPPKQAQFPSKHFVGGNGPTRDHPDPLPVRPMNMLPSMVGYAEAGPSNQAYSGKPENSRRKKIATATISSETVLIPDDSPPQPTAPKLQKKQFDERRFDDQRFVERRFENRRFEERRQMTASQSAQVTPPSLQHPSQMQVQQHLQVAAPPPPQAPPPQRQVQVLAPPVQVPVAKPKPVEKPRPREKRIFVVADHQRCVMSNLSSLWKSGKLCDAGIGNGSSTVMVHKVVLSAVCPKLLSVFSTDILSHKFLQVNFPEEVSTEALNAFAEYMYNGILDLDRDILEQLKIIAKRLDMKEFEQLCDSHLPNHMHQPSAAATSSFTHIPLIQTSMPIPDITSSLVSPITTSIQSAPSITTQVIDVKQEITDAELAQVQKDTAAVFGQESAVSSLAPNKSGSAAGFVICPSIKTEPVGPDDNRYGCLTSSNDQVFTSTTSSSQPTATASYTSVSSVPASSTEYSINFSQSTDVKSTRLKVSHTYETPLVSDLSPVSRIVQTVCSQSSAIKEDSSKTLTRQQPTSSIELPLTSSNNSGIYPVGLFTAAGANLPLLTTETVDVKTIDLYKTDLT